LLVFPTAADDPPPLPLPLPLPRTRTRTRTGTPRTPMQSFADIIAEYKVEYERCFHRLVKVYVGLPFPFDAFSQAQVQWRVAKVRLDRHPWPLVSDLLNRYSKNAAALAEVYKVCGGARRESGSLGVWESRPLPPLPTPPPPSVFPFCCCAGGLCTCRKCVWLGGGERLVVLNVGMQPSTRPALPRQ
jgi:hypothetical protein